MESKERRLFVGQCPSSLSRRLGHRKYVTSCHGRDIAERLAQVEKNTTLHLETIRFSNRFFERWSEYERSVAEKQQYRQDEHQLRSDWNDVLTFANQPGESLGHAHIFALAHILRRPIIVYGVTNVKSYRGEYFIGLARFQGVYLPLLWETSFCSKSPICLGFTRNHFSALVPMQERIHMSTSPSSSSSSRSSSPLTNQHEAHGQVRPVPSSSPPLVNPSPHDHQDLQTFYHPLMDCDGNLLPVHFLTSSEVKRLSSRFDDQSRRSSL